MLHGKKAWAHLQKMWFVVYLKLTFKCSSLIFVNVVALYFERPLSGEMGLSYLIYFQYIE